MPVGTTDQMRRSTDLADSLSEIGKKKKEPKKINREKGGYSGTGKKEEETGAAVQG